MLLTSLPRHPNQTHCLTGRINHHQKPYYLKRSVMRCLYMTQKGGKQRQGFFLVFSGAKTRPHPQWKLGAFFPILKTKSQSSKKKIFFFFLVEWDFHSVNTSFMVTFSFNLKAICVMARFFLSTKTEIIMHYNKFPNLGVCQANFPNLKGPSTPSQNCKI